MMFQVNTFQIPDISALITNVIGVIIRKIPIGDFTQKINRTSLVVDHVWSCVIKMREDIDRGSSMHFQRELANVPIFRFRIYILLPLVYTHVPA